ncbi:MAG: Extracellular solute-binding protein family 1 [Desulfotomaculum sp. 46_296]|nr:MAG: Extracellular solute-binding protein family 1 [Desulfotomaculum sp. 46_296]HAU31990.1 tungsten ABC transporter substrate-binding protein [Desulfotomaculum sp.]
MFSKTKWLVLTVAFLILLSLVGCANKNPKPAEEENKAAEGNKTADIILATTTSTQDSGLLDVLIPEFEKQSGYKVKTIAVGTGAALAMGEKGDADVLLVHAPADEKKLVDSGIGINYQLVMHNDFIIIGPKDDPAKISGLKTASEALKKIAESGSMFISRGDNSGTHKKELRIWKSAGITPKVGATYQETGQGMGQTLNIAEQKSGYTLTDRATYLAQKKNLSLVILVEGEKSLLNIYHVMQVNPEKFANINARGAQAFVEFMVSPDTQKMISTFGVDKYGQPLFTPDEGKNEADLGK